MTSNVESPPTLEILNINIGLLGHVDSGKTSLAKCLSHIGSTACFDKHPQSQERGITIDLGFSSFSSNLPDKFENQCYKKIQYTLVDCPGHASLIRTIIGGINIIDLVLLVIDITKGIQTQTAECLVISQIAKKPLMVALNKIDLVGVEKRDATIQKVTKKLEQAFSDTTFKDAPIIPIVAKEDYTGNRGIEELIKKLSEVISIPKREMNKPFVLAVDHCFLIKGKGTILTGTVLQGSIKLNDSIEIPVLKEVRKVKSIQMFRRNVLSAGQGDRIGICVKQFDPSQLERALVCNPGYIPLLYAVIMSINKVKYFKGDILSNAKYHISVGYETLIGKITLFSKEDDSKFDFERDYPFKEKYTDESSDKYYGLIEFEKPIYVPPDCIIIGSKLDQNINLNSCRIAFFGTAEYNIHDKNYITELLPKLKLYVNKEKVGVVQNIISENEIIGQRLFKNSSSLQKFLNFEVKLSTGECGFIDSSFGQREKIRIRIPDGLKPSTFEILSSKKQKKNKLKNESTNQENMNDKKETVKIILRFKRYIFDKEKNIYQHFKT